MGVGVAAHLAVCTARTCWAFALLWMGSPALRMGRAGQQGSVYWMPGARLGEGRCGTSGDACMLKPAWGCPTPSAAAACLAPAPLSACAD